MNKKFLILTEGQVTEPNFLIPLFQKYGFNVNKEEQIDVRIGVEIQILKNMKLN